MALAPLQIRRATKKRAKLRMNIEAQPGGGKTYSAILIAKLLIGEPFKLPDDRRSKIVVIDSERASAELYADEFDFETVDLDPSHHGPKGYVEAIRAAESFGAEVIIADSITHEWKWCLAEVDRIKPKFGGNKWSAWSEVRPQHDDFVDAMMGCNAHFIATTRAKPGTAQDKDENGKTVIKKVGLEGVQDDMIEFAFGVVLRLDSAHVGTISKTRCRALDGGVFPMPGEAFASELRRWLDSGDPLVEVAHTLVGAIEQGVALAKTATTAEQKKAAWGKASEHLIGWCKAHGRSVEETKSAIADMRAKMTAAAPPVVTDKPAATGDQAPPPDVSAPAAATPPKAPLDDAEKLRAIDEGRA